MHLQWVCRAFLVRVHHFGLSGRFVLLTLLKASRTDNSTTTGKLKFLLLLLLLLALSPPLPPQLSAHNRFYIQVELDLMGRILAQMEQTRAHLPAAPRLRIDNEQLPPHPTERHVRHFPPERGRA